MATGTHGNFVRVYYVSQIKQASVQMNWLSVIDPVISREDLARLTEVIAYIRDNGDL